VVAAPAKASQLGEQRGRQQCCKQAERWDSSQLASSVTVIFEDESKASRNTILTLLLTLLYPLALMSSPT